MFLSLGDLIIKLLLLIGLQLNKNNDEPFFGIGHYIRSNAELKFAY